MTQTRTRLVPWLCAMCMSCGGGGQNIQAKPFTEEMASLFEDGADYVGDPEVLAGNWREQWSNQLRGRVQHADVIAVATVRAIKTDTNLGGQTTLRVSVRLDAIMFGSKKKTPRDLALPVSENDEGYPTIKGHDDQLLNQHYVTFVRWFTDEDGRVKPRWHLSPASRKILIMTQNLIEEHRTNTRRVTVHRQ